MRCLAVALDGLMVLAVVANATYWVWPSVGGARGRVRGACWSWAHSVSYLACSSSRFMLKTMSTLSTACLKHPVL